MSVKEITWADWEQYAPNSRPDNQSRKHPAAYIAYSNALAYCKFLSKKSGLTVRLPSEIEWEYAARAGIRQAPFPWGWGPPERLSCFNAESACRTGQYEPNPWGLFDMTGNVFEWCHPSGDVPKEMHVARGGSWAERNPDFLNVGRRTFFPAGYKDADVGFRILVEKTNP